MNVRAESIISLPFQQFLVHTEDQPKEIEDLCYMVHARIQSNPSEEFIAFYCPGYTIESAFQ